MTKNKKSRAEKDLLFYQSWGDLVALLLVFFVFLFSMSTLDVSKFKEMTSTISNIFSLQEKEEMMEKYLEEERILKQLLADLQGYVMANSLSDDVSAKIDDHTIVMDLGSNLLFQLGSADLKLEAEGVLRAFTEYFKQISNAKIVVEGHTDDIPIKKKEFPSNWELSAGRAASVVRFLAKYGIKEENCYIIGYNQYKPLVPNDSVENRAKNRRVRIIFEPIVNLENEGVDFSSIENLDTDTEILDVTMNVGVDIPKRGEQAVGN